MKHRSRFLTTVALFAVIAAGLAAEWHFLGPHPKPTPPLPGAVVKVMIDGGHGSGVSIGGGYIVTAGHVAQDFADVQIKTDTGIEGKADVIWNAKDYDIALLHTDTPLQAAKIDCRVLPVGEAIHAKGNPSDQEFVTTWGRIGGQSAIDTPWKSAVVVDITLVPGMSGGAMLDDRNDLVGILVGAIQVEANPFAISYVVPMSGVCGILGRS